MYCDICKMMISHAGTPFSGWYKHSLLVYQLDFTINKSLPFSIYVRVYFFNTDSHSWVPVFYRPVIHYCPALLWYSHGHRFGQWEPL